MEARLAGAETDRVQEESRPFLPLMMTSAGWGLLITGLGWTVLAS